ncbi:uncharacterized protein LOC116165819 [Photinus pyralis]|uniref:uncharacterized protein LOC116165819 n=1 Tax=Photinus pyralis TaxID=7054 RepID=UPI0012675007|nr:uncharacterized protein LOC116165819 [Photinus pyralis]
MDSDAINTITFYGRRYDRLDAAIEDIVNRNDSYNPDIVLLPPAVDYVTDEEDIDEGVIQTNELPTDVPGEIEVQFYEDEVSEDDLPLSRLQDILLSNTSSSRTTSNPKWTNDVLDISMKASTEWKLREETKKSGKKDKGYFCKKYDEENKLLFVQWKDNNIVSMGTKYDAVEPLAKVKRWSKEKKEKIDVSQPVRELATGNLQLQ